MVRVSQLTPRTQCRKFGGGRRHRLRDGFSSNRRRSGSSNCARPVDVVMGLFAPATTLRGTYLCVR